MELRPPTRDDLAPAASLLERTGLPPLPDGFESANIVVAAEGVAIVGVMALQVAGPFGLVRSAAVEPARRGRGVGTDILQRLLARARALRLRELYLLTEGAEPFFSRAGFVPVLRDEVPGEIRKTWEYHPECPETATVMRLSLTAADPGL